ncbi:MAG: PIN domain-containing protein [Variovorax sp.]|nr:MAG: PIN domain-containing protein [Variovorax sp.]
MKLPDTNVLLNAVQVASPFHPSAKRWMEEAFNGSEGVGLAWVVLLGFLRISTRSGILKEPLPMPDALAVVDSWLLHPNARIVQPGELHSGILGRLLLTGAGGSNLSTDAHLAALAIEHNAEVGTFDRDFKRFAGLRFELLA